MKKRICFLECNDKRLLESIKYFKRNSSVEFILISTGFEVFSKEIEGLTEIINIPNEDLIFSNDEFTSKQVWIYNNFERLNIDSIVLGLRTEKKTILRTLLNHKEILVFKDKRIYGYAPFFFKNLNRKIFLLDPLIQIRPNKKELQEIAINFIEEHNRFYKGNVSGVFISYAIEKESNNINKRWEILYNLKRLGIKNYFHGVTQLDSALLNELKSPDGKTFGPTNTVIFPDLLSANATLKSLGFAEQEIDSGGIIISDLKKLRHGVITRNCRANQLINLIKELTR